MNTTRAFIYTGIVLLLLAGALFEYSRGSSLVSALASSPAFQSLVAVPVNDPGIVSTSTATTTTLVDIGTASSTPVVTDSSGTSATITLEEVIALTNVQRSTQADLPPLTENADLNAAAAAKLNDMFAEQYFAHTSPNGTGPGDLAEQAGYNYVVEGENLAEGSFKNTQDLIAAWMASPGHRANILNTRYMDIGVAVGRGMYDGQEVWMAVQEFGKPLSSCPAVDTGLHDAIGTNQSRATDLSSELDAIKQALVAAATGTPDENTTYNQIANHYNDDVNLYNGVVTRLKAEIASYNQEVEAFNTCVNG